MENKLNFFLLDNKSGHKTTEKWLLANRPEILKEINEYIINNNLGFDLTIKEKIWYYINDITNKCKCLNCEKDLKFKRSLDEGYGEYCSISCTNKSEKHIKSSKHSRSLKQEEITEKIRNTTLKRYGVDNIFKDKEKIKESIQKKYGVDSVHKIDGNYKKVSDSLKDYNINNKGKVLEKGRRYSLDRANEFIDRFSEFKFNNATGDVLDINCEQCNSDYEINRAVFRHRIDLGIKVCTKCNPINNPVSSGELELREFVSTLTADLIFNDRKILDGKEIDILIKSKFVGIEYNGIYWHSDSKVSNTYHLEKYKIAKSKGIRLIQFFQDEINDKNAIVKSIIRNAINNNSNTKIFARKCIIKDVSVVDSRIFLNENHLQGYVNSSNRYGLYYNDELVSLMTFGGYRVNLGRERIDNEYELLRFANKLNTNIIGGSNKLFKHFIKLNNPNKIISYSDNRIFSGDMYNTLGLIFKSESKPNYFYIKYEKRENRFKYRKSELIKDGFNGDMSESEIMKSRGYNKIYDCGNKLFEWTKPL